MDEKDIQEFRAGRKATKVKRESERLWEPESEKRESEKLPVVKSEKPPKPSSAGLETPTQQPTEVTVAQRNLQGAKKLFQDRHEANHCPDPACVMGDYV